MEGQWYFDQMHGHGVLAHWAPDQGVLVYEGEFRDGHRSGSGRLIARDGGGLFGNWEDRVCGSRAELNAWKLTLQAAHQALIDACEAVGAPVGSWEQLQAAFPAVKQRLVPLADLGQRLFVCCSG
eukprot:Skav214320  [mRNA]  locus=scaffold86:29056:31040:+ [translate_table: standard]